MVLGSNLAFTYLNKKNDVHQYDNRTKEQKIVSQILF